MKKLFLILAIVSLPLIFLACATGPPLTQSDIDPGPYPENYQQIIVQHLRQTLIDPDSLQDLSSSRPNRITLDAGYPSFGLRKGQEVYQCRVMYNAKNRMGGYTGKQLHTLFIRNGEVVAAF